MDAGADLFELHVEADPRGLSTVRVFVRALARSVDAGPERTDDLELLVSEVCSELVEGGGSSWHLTIRRSDGTLDVAVDGEGANVSIDGEEKAFRRDLLSQLSPDAAWSAAGARFTLHA